MRKGSRRKRRRGRITVNEWNGRTATMRFMNAEPAEGGSSVRLLWLGCCEAMRTAAAIAAAAVLV
jgi:hypothetical protein